MTPLSEAQLPQQGVAMSDRRDVREAGDRLRKTELFAGLSDAEASVLGTFVEQVAVETGTVVVRQGDVADSLYVIHAGEVEVRSRGADGESTPSRHSAPATTSARSACSRPASASPTSSPCSRPSCSG